MEKTLRKEYAGKGITIVWEPSKCVHSGICRNGLPDVFDPNRRPWIEPDAAPAETVADLIDRCPSGALSYFFAEGQEPIHKPEADNRAEIQVEMAENGPLLVQGRLAVKKADGETEHREGMTAFCRCGKTGNPPYCDGSHAKKQN